MIRNCKLFQINHSVAVYAVLALSENMVSKCILANFTRQNRKAKQNHCHCNIFYDFVCVWFLFSLFVVVNILQTVNWNMYVHNTILVNYARLIMQKKNL